MDTTEGRVVEVSLDRSGDKTAWIACDEKVIPSPGQYLLAVSPSLPEAPLGAPLFACAVEQGQFCAAPPIPGGWEPGQHLNLRGPIGRGFTLLRQRQTSPRLALAGSGDSAGRLMPLAAEAVELGWDAALFTDAPLPALPSAVEAYPLSELPGALSWAGCLALDLPLDRLPRLRHILGLDPFHSLSLPAQALIYTPMPCAGLASCGVCAVPARHGWKLACQDGPVFDLHELSF